MGRPVVHFEVGCKDKTKTADFCAKLFDWKLAEAGPATRIAAEPGSIPRHIVALGHEPHSFTNIYADVEDVASYVEKAKALGGKALVPPVELPTGTSA